MYPEIQLGSGIFSVIIIGLSTGEKFSNSDFNCSDRPKLIDAFIFTTWCNPSIFEWALLFTSSTTFLNNKKSPPPPFPRLSAYGTGLALIKWG